MYANPYYHTWSFSISAKVIFAFILAVALMIIYSNSAVKLKANYKPRTDFRGKKPSLMKVRRLCGNKVQPPCRLTIVLPSTTEDGVMALVGVFMVMRAIIAEHWFGILQAFRNFAGGNWADAIGWLYACIAMVALANVLFCLFYGIAQCVQHVRAYNLKVANFRARRYVNIAQRRSLYFAAQCIFGHEETDEKSTSCKRYAIKPTVQR